jgi:type I restriction enzyme M protein
MIKIVFSTEKEMLSQQGIIRTIYDPAMGTGGMINLAKNYVLDELLSGNKNKPDLKTYGQEINEQSYAIAKSESLITGENAEKIGFKTNIFITNLQIHLMGLPGAKTPTS